MKLTNKKRFMFKDSRNERWGLRENGDWVIPPVYDELTRINDRFFIAHQNGKAGVITLENNTALPVAYDSVDRIAHNDVEVCVVRKDNLFGLFNAVEGLLALPVEFDDISVERDVCIVNKDGKYGFYNASIGEFVSGCIFSSKPDVVATRDDGCVYKVECDGKFGLASSGGKSIFECVFSSIEEFVSGRAVATLNSRKGVISVDGKTCVPFMYDLILLFAGGTALAFIGALVYDGADDGAWPDLSYAERFESLVLDGLIADSDDFVEHFYFRNGLKLEKMQKAIPNGVTKCWKAANGVSFDELMHIDDLYFWLSSNESWDCPYPDFCDRSSLDFYVVRKGSLYGALDKDGRRIIPCVYDSIEANNDSILLARNKKGLTVYDTSGKKHVTDYAEGGMSVWHFSADRGLFMLKHTVLNEGPFPDRYSVFSVQQNRYILEDCRTMEQVRWKWDAYVCE